MKAELIESQIRSLLRKLDGGSCGDGTYDNHMRRLYNKPIEEEIAKLRQLKKELNNES